MKSEILKLTQQTAENIISEHSKINKSKNRSVNNAANFGLDQLTQILTKSEKGSINQSESLYLLNVASNLIKNISLTKIDYVKQTQVLEGAVGLLAIIFYLLPPNTSVIKNFQTEIDQFISQIEVFQNMVFNFIGMPIIYDVLADWLNELD